MRKLLAPFAPLILSGLVSAQTCSDNLYPLHLVDSQGVPAPVVNDLAQFATDGVYLAFSPTIPSGTYYVHVTTPLDGTDSVLSANHPQDRFIAVNNSGGTITLSLPFTTGQTPPVFGLGLGGVGQSILLAPFVVSPDNNCEFKVWLGDCWDLSNGPENPYLLTGGLHPSTGQCCVFSYEGFQIGGALGNDVCGSVFFDTDRDGTRDPGEDGIGGITVSLTGSGGTSTVQSAADGTYCFLGVATGSYTAALQLGSSGYLVTTANQFVVVANGCSDGLVPDFGVAPHLLACDGHTPGFWRNRHGKALVTQFNILATLPALCLRNATGQQVAPANVNAWATWLQQGEATNMAYMLSVHLAAMHCNVIVGFVDGGCLVNGGGNLGTISIGNLMQQAQNSLCAHPFTPSGSPHRAAQEALKNALDAANNNLNWL